MRLRLALLLALLAMADLAHAQPGATAPAPPPTPAQPSLQPPAPCSSCDVPVYTSYPPPLITAEEHRLLLRGEISQGRYITGGVVSAVMGFGLGHTVQGRWRERGWVFTAGGSASLLVTFVGIASTLACAGHSDNERCDPNHRVLIGGFLAFVGFRIWEIADAFAAPPRHNARVRSLKQRLGLSAPYALVPYVTPHGDGATAGLGLRF